MAYTVLARKYRSQTFEEVIGQDPIVQTLKNAIKTDRVAHAYLFTGTRGVGKTTVARILAKSLNCLSADAPTPKPCCECDSCTAISIGEDIDVIEIDGASNRGIDNIRELRENAIYRPARSRFKIYIIDEVHMLTPEAFNALLKTLEEPPSHVKFIFATTEPNKVLPTIQSRCQRFDFHNIGAAQIAKQLRSILEQEKIKYEDDVVLPIAKMANGSMRDGLSLLDRLVSTGVEPLTDELLEQYLGCPNSEKIWQLISKIGDSDAAGTLAATEELITSGHSEVQIVDSLTDYMRDLMVVKSTGTDSELVILTAEQRKRAGELAEKFDLAGIIYAITALEKLRWSVKNSDTPRALLDALLLRLAMSEHFLNVDTLLSQLQGGAPIKKNKVGSGNSSPVSQVPQVETAEAAGIPPAEDLRSIKDDWAGVIELVRVELGNGTVGLLSSAWPSQIDDDRLTVTFPATAQIQKKMLESNGRAEKIESVISKHFGRPVKLQLEVSAAHPEAAPSAPKATGRRNELLNDPAVKMILTGLDATITGIEESGS
jgi:DNA polymerase-3 subunit gamma/tau